MKPSERLDNSALSATHHWISHISAQALFLSGFNFFIITLVVPLLIKQWALTNMSIGLIGAAAPFGAIIGSLLFGHLADRLGRKSMLIFSALLIILCSIASVTAWDSHSLILFRFLLGIGLGAEYPISASYLCETLPKNVRGKNIAIVMLVNCLGAFIGVFSSYMILLIHPSLDAWRAMFAIGIVPAAVIFLLRFQIPESPRWLMHKGRFADAKKAITKITGSKHIDLEPQPDSAKLSLRHGYLFKITFIASACWLLMDISNYGVGVFTPLIMHTLHITQNPDFIAQILSLSKASVIVNSFVLCGAIGAVLVIDKVSRLRLQAFGFIGIAIGLIVLATSTLLPHGHMILVYLGFILFNIALNLGPGVTTYLLPAEFYPTYLRATGHGIATACGKLGAVLGIFLFPILQQQLGLVVLLIILAAYALLGFVLTRGYPVDTRQRSIDEIEQLLQKSGNAQPYRH